MTAPIVWHDDRSLMADEEKFDVGLQYGSTKLRASYSKTYAIAQTGIPGQLWKRVAEADVALHGEPQPEDARRKMRRFQDKSHRPDPTQAAEILKDLIAYRREKARA